MAGALSRLDPRLAVPMLSFIIQCLNEAAEIGTTLVALEPLRKRGAEVIVVDGGSTDATVTLARTHTDRVVHASRGRARQMNAGAAHARGEVLVFVHADTILPEHADELIRNALHTSGRRWGRFDVTIRGGHPLFCLIAASMNLRSRYTCIATGDQAMFVTRELFDAAKGFPEIALMEDVALSTALKRIGPPVCLRERVSTSGRRWQKHGLVRTVLLMWRLRLAYWCGADPNALAERSVRHEA
jgi:rSAM/selenodomain-associated transferase 2